jgi:uncharacterized glyoxalase superfamily protein PhnB
MAATVSVFLNVNDIEKSIEWYGALGFKVEHSFDTKDGRLAYADLALDGAELSLGAIPTNSDPGFRAWVGTPLGAGVVVYVTVPKVEKLWAAAKKAGAVVEAPLEERSYGRVFTLNDPDGYTISFITEPKRRAARAKPKAAARKPAKARKAKRGKR